MQRQSTRQASEERVHRRHQLPLLIVALVAATAMGGTTAATALAHARQHAAAVAADEEWGSIIDVSHLPPLLTVKGEKPVLDYRIACFVPGPDPLNGPPCDAQGDVFIRAGQQGAFRRLPLSADAETPSDGMYSVSVPDDIAASGDGFSYYAVLRNADTGATSTLPRGGAEAPQRSFSMGAAVEVDLGEHDFGAERSATERVVAADWGSGPGEVGLQTGRDVSTVGPSAFDVGDDGTITVLDQLNGRALRYTPGSATASRATPDEIKLDLTGGIADMSVAEDGTMYILEPNGAGRGETPLLREVAADGTPISATNTAEKITGPVRVGRDGPVVQQFPADQWMPMGTDERLFGLSAQLSAARPGLLQEDGNEIVLLRTGNEIRVAKVSAQRVVEAWRVKSPTDVAEVQLAEAQADGDVVVVARRYTEEDGGYSVLELDGRGIADEFNLGLEDYAETSALTRFRLVGDELYQFGSDPDAMYVDRFELEESR